MSTQPHDPASTTQPAGAGSAPKPILIAVDGTNLLHRTHHAHAATQRRNAEGAAVWALAGLARLLATATATVTRLWRAPAGLVVCFDGPRDACRRRAMDPSYKASRRTPDPDLESQLGSAPAWLTAAGVSVLTVDGYEADDGCASAATAAAAAGWRCVIATSDRDAFAHASAATRILRPINGGGWEALGAREIAARYDLPVEGYHGIYGYPAYAAYAALRGDKSDELPGVPQIGEKTAAAIIGALAGVERDVEAVIDGDEVAGAALKARHRDLLVAGAVNYRRNRRLMDAVVDLAVDLTAAGAPLDGAQVRAACAAQALDASVEALLGLRPQVASAA